MVIPDLTGPTPGYRSEYPLGAATLGPELFRYWQGGVEQVIDGGEITAQGELTVFFNVARVGIGYLAIKAFATEFAGVSGSTSAGGVFKLP